MQETSLWVPPFSVFNVWRRIFRIFFLFDLNANQRWFATSIQGLGNDSSGKHKTAREDVEKDLGESHSGFFPTTPLKTPLGALLRLATRSGPHPKKTTGSG
ncbi:MAG: hypothetical protein CM15mP120_23000 [Pseudomonadota bacterium]|nr:MAG: hypothetical protein CM15mP120_23000 [Pseudomonadota bacterium]